MYKNENQRERLGGKLLGNQNSFSIFILGIINVLYTVLF